MASINFNELFDSLKTGVADLAKGTVTDYVGQATQEGQDTLDQMRADIEQWSKSIATGDMNTDDLKFLIEGRKELTEMRGLEQLGIAQIELDKFKSGMIDLVIGGISKFI